MNTGARFAARPSPGRTKLRRLAISAPAAACAAILAADFAAAQQDQGLALEEIVVTTRFREERLQEIPLAISAITAETLDSLGATDVLDIAAWVPNVTIDQLGAGWGPTLAANIRGLGYGDFKPTVEQTVQFYVDDVVIGRPTGAILDLLDLERVEVLRGPQGTLFGKNAIGGVVRLVSKRPGEDPGGSLEVTTGTYGRLDLRGSFDTTLIEDRLHARVAFTSRRKEGWQNNVDFRCAMVESGRGALAGVGDGIVGWAPDPDGSGPLTAGPILGVVGSPADNAFALPTRVSERGTDRNCVVGRFGDRNMEAARGALRFTPNDKFELNFVADVTDQRDTSPYDLISAIGSPGLINAYNAQVANPSWGVPYDNRFAAPDIYTNYSGFNDNGGIDGGIETPNINDVKHWGTSATLDWYLGDVDVKLILAHREFDAQWGRDSDGSPMPINHTLDTFRHDQDSVEIRVSGQLFNDRTSWTIGYFDLDQYDLNTNISVLFPNSNCNGLTTPGIIGVACIDRVDNVWVENSGMFLNTVTDLTDKLALTVGLRRSEDNKDILQERFNRFGQDIPGFQDPVLVLARAEKTDPMVSLSYQLQDSIMLYATYQEGFRGGGTTPRPSPGIRVPFGPEELDNFEIGIKSDLLDNRLRLNASYYDMTYSDLQQNAAGLDEFGNPTWLTTNAGEADLDGFEVELQSTIGEYWLLEGSISNLNYQLTDLGNASPEARIALGLDPAGAPDINEGPNRSPEWTATIGFGYIRMLENGAELSFRYGGSWRDKTWWGTDGDDAAPGNVIPAHTISSARLTWVSPERDWQASLFCTNCTDERVTQSTLNFLGLFGSLQETYIDPEEWGFSIRRNFQ